MLSLRCPFHNLNWTLDQERALWGMYSSFQSHFAGEEPAAQQS